MDQNRMQKPNQTNQPTNNQTKQKKKTSTWAAPEEKDSGRHMGSALRSSPSSPVIIGSTAGDGWGKGRPGPPEPLGASAEGYIKTELTQVWWLTPLILAWKVEVGRFL